METNSLESILKEYDSKHSLYKLFSQKIENLIKDLLNENGIRIHSITSRVKDRDSFQKKIIRRECDYLKLEDINDIVGVRIITYFADEVDIVADIIKREFNVDAKKSTDIRQMIDPDRFGYVSLHYVVNLLDSRLQLMEYKRFSGCKAEIQIRSILQHTWAEIEHDLGYKSEISVPKTIRRRLSRLAGLLELADNEFLNIRNDLVKYKEKVTREIIKEPGAVFIDKVSLEEFIKNTKLVGELDAKIVAFTKGKIKEDRGLIDHYVRELTDTGLKTIAELKSALSEFHGLIIAFADKWLSGSSPKEFPQGISLFYLCYVKLGFEAPFEKIVDYLKANYIGNDCEKCAQQVIDTCNMLKEKQ